MSVFTQTGVLRHVVSIPSGSQRIPSHEKAPNHILHNHRNHAPYSACYCCLFTWHIMTELLMSCDVNHAGVLVHAPSRHAGSQKWWRGRMDINALNGTIDIRTIVIRYKPSNTSSVLPMHSILVFDLPFTAASYFSVGDKTSSCRYITHFQFTVLRTDQKTFVDRSGSYSSESLRPKP